MYDHDIKNFDIKNGATGAVFKAGGNACCTSNQGDVFGMLGDYITSKVRRLSSNVDQETKEVIENEIISDIEKNRRIFMGRSIQIAMYLCNIQQQHTRAKCNHCLNYLLSVKKGSN